MTQPSKEEYLKAIADEIHKPVRRVKNRRSVHSSFMDEIWSMDLVEMGEWKDDNDGEMYMLTIVDVFTRFAWARPTRTKTANDCFAAFIDVVDSSKRQPTKIWVDQGSEFYNSTFKKWMASQKPPVVMYSTFGESKSVIVERFNRTLKTKM
jgi:transposase InsO family protein